MSNNEEGNDDDLTPPGGQENYKVGYGKPPENGRFKKGKSGNTKGRPKGSKNSAPAFGEERFKDIILKEANRTIKVQDGGHSVSMPMAEAVFRSISLNAVKGRPGAQRIFTEMLFKTEQQNKARLDEWAETLIEYKYDWEQELLRCKAHGLPTPKLEIHPDQIKIDLKNKNIWIEGPIFKEEKEEHQRIIDQLNTYGEHIADLRDELEKTKDEDEKTQIQEEIDYIRAC